MKSSSNMITDIKWKDLIPSKDVRELIEKEGYTFSDFEIATLIFNGLQAYDEKRAALQTLAESTMDMELKVMINKRLVWEENEITFFEEEKAGYVYLLNSKEFAPEDCYCGCFVNAKLAHAYGCKLGFDFCIEKHVIIGSEQTECPKSKIFTNPYLKETKDWAECEYECEQINTVVARFHYVKEGVLLYFASEMERDLKEELEMLFDPARFENAYMEIPNPFEKGDVVHVVGTDRYRGDKVTETEISNYLWEALRYEGPFHDELAYYIMTVDFEKFFCFAVKYADVSMGEIVEAIFEKLFGAKYMYFDEVETHYIIGDTIKESDSCVLGCNHMG